MATAGAIKVTISGALDNGNLDLSFAPGQVSIEQRRALAHSPIVSVGTSEEDMPVGDVVTLGWVVIQNLDAANFIKYGPKNAGSMVEFGRLKAGEMCALRLEPGITWTWIADTAACLAHVDIWND